MVPPPRPSRQRAGEATAAGAASARRTPRRPAAWRAPSREPASNLAGISRGREAGRPLRARLLAAG